MADFRLNDVTAMHVFEQSGVIFRLTRMGSLVLAKFNTRDTADSSSFNNAAVTVPDGFRPTLLTNFNAQMDRTQTTVGMWCEQNGRLQSSGIRAGSYYNGFAVWTTVDEWPEEND